MANAKRKADAAASSSRALAAPQEFDTKENIASCGIAGCSYLTCRAPIKITVLGQGGWIARLRQN